ncbi:nitrous oxide reductase accessory protein NosL [Marinobacter sp.]|uniref:nitrous oxide reductase accessory protein NosL n=1 Tax=Marinobacter sp. TaxID=50741 RepID=UPI003569044E
MAFSLALAACSGSEETAQAKPDAVHFESGDECHVCGMVITRFPGPKGESISGKEQQVRKFCSTKDMFSWVLQPENVKRDHVLYVHDMAETDWDHPDDTALIDAREAFYVVGSERTGAMGPTLASFAEESAAEAFASEFGGEVVAFADVTMEHLSSGGGVSSGMGGSHSM